MMRAAGARARFALRSLAAAFVIAGMVACGPGDHDAAQGGGRTLEVWTPESGSRL
jgi:hypothetical protein